MNVHKYQKLNIFRDHSTLPPHTKVYKKKYIYKSHNKIYFLDWGNSAKTCLIRLGKIKNTNNTTLCTLDKELYDLLKDHIPNLKIYKEKLHSEFSSWSTTTLEKYVTKYYPKKWKDFFTNFNFQNLSEFLEKEVQKNIVYPPLHEVFAIFDMVAPTLVKALIIGQDPYIREGQAHGCAFSVKKGFKPLPPSLKNIYKELVASGWSSSEDGYLGRWINQGVFLLNTALTVREGVSESHIKEWKNFTNCLLRWIDKNCKNIVVIMWGGKAQAYEKIFKNPTFRFVKSVHPSPLSCKKFFGSDPFNKTNSLLEDLYRDPIDWNLF